MSIYLDHSATTPIIEPVRLVIESMLTENFGNPSSLHKLGLNAEKAIKQARKQIAECVKASDRNVIFTSGGTEANNLAIFGSIRKERGRLITTSFEHPSVLKVMEHLETEGYDVVYLDIDQDGQISIEQLKDALNDQTQLVSIMYVNNEIGSIQPINKIGAIIAEYNKENHKKIKFHVDAIQAFGKLKIDIEDAEIDLLSISSHKINGLKGTGALVLKDTLEVKPMFFGGGQERAIRPGTENIVGIVAFGKAAEVANSKIDLHWKHVTCLKNKMVEILNGNSDIIVNGKGHISPYILSASFLGVKGEVMLHSLETSKIYVSTGSACNSKKQSFSHVLKALKLPDLQIDGTLRISFSALNTEAEIEIAGNKMVSDYMMIKKMIKRR